MENVGYAALQIIPSFEGFQGKLERGTAADMAAAGKAGGAKFGEAAAKEGGEGFSSRLGSSIKSKVVAGAGLAAGLAFGGAMASALERGALDDKLAAQLGAGSKKAKLLGQVSGDLYTNAFGDSMEGVNDAIRQVVTNIDGMRHASKSKLEDITATVLNLNAAFDEEPAAITRAAAQMQRTGLAKNTKEALDVITAGFQSGADKAQDLLDTYNEYGTQFRKLGINGAQATGLITQGLKAGARDADIVADTFKEFSIRAVDGSDLTQQSFNKLGLSAKDMQEKIGAGGKSAADATELVLNKLRDIEDPARRAQIAVGLFGTQSEDMGNALYALDLPKAARDFDNVGGAAKRMGDTLNDNASSKVTTFTRKLKMGVVDFLAHDVIPAIEDFADGPEGKKLGQFFSDATDKIGPFADKTMPALGDALDAAIPLVRTAAHVVGDLAGAFARMPKWAQTAIVGGGLAAGAAGKFGLLPSLGSLTGGGGKGGLLGGVSRTAPLPVYVVNSLPGAGGTGAPGVIPGGGGLPGGAPIGTLPKFAPLIPVGIGSRQTNADLGIKPLDDSKILNDFYRQAALGAARFQSVMHGNITNLQAEFLKLPKTLQTDIKLNGVPESKKAALELVRQYNLTPSQVRTVFDTAGVAGGIKAAQDLAMRYAGIPKSVITNFHLNGVEAARQQIATLNAGITALQDRGDHLAPYLHGGARADGGTIPHFDWGGTVGGKRMPYGDKVLTWLAPGEEVVSNRNGQADRHRSLLKAINAGRLADGGTVGGSVVHTRVIETLPSGSIRAYVHGLGDAVIELMTDVADHRIAADRRFEYTARGH